MPRKQGTVFTAICCFNHSITILYHRQSTRSSDEYKHSAVPAVESGKPRRHCNAATAAASVFQMTSQTTAVKINPLCESGSHDNARADVGDVNPVFYGQRTKIRKTKEQEMISAILEVTTNGI